MRVAAGSASMVTYGTVAGHLPHRFVTWLYARQRLTGLIRGAMNAVLPAELREVEVMAGPLTGARLLIFPRNELSFISGLWEFWVQDAIAEHLQPGDRAWDVGAYIGYFTLLMRWRCGSGNVVALEPDPANRGRLERVLAINHAEDVRVLPIAAGRENGMVGLLRQEDQPAATSATARRELVVPARTLDSLVPELGEPRLVKVDVEGAEADVLEGAKRLLHEIQPTWIVELHGAAGGQAVQILLRAGYDVRSLNRSAVRTHQEHVIAVPPRRTIT